MVDNTYLPFFVPATPHGHSGRIFLGLSQKNGPINVYRISVLTSSGSSTVPELLTMVVLLSYIHQCVFSENQGA